MKPKILIGSPVCQKSQILRLFLQSLAALSDEKAEVHYVFIDDNKDEVSADMLHEFAAVRKDAVEVWSAGAVEAAYVCDETTHRWSDELVWRVAELKNRLIERARQSGYDGLFLIDSDVLLHPDTLSLLLAADKEIVAEIFWTSWQPNTIPLPQVWLSDEYTLYERKPGETLTREQQLLRQYAFLGQLRAPGVYEVGGLGACTLIRRSALEAGVHFGRIANVSFWGEDRHFCVRALALGLALHVDTHHPAYHVYRETDVPEAAEWLAGVIKQVEQRGQSAQTGPRNELQSTPPGGPYSALPGTPQGSPHSELPSASQTDPHGELSSIPQPDPHGELLSAPQLGPHGELLSAPQLGPHSELSSIPQPDPHALLSTALYAVRPEPRPKLTLSMVICNEADKYLAKVLSRHREYIDEAVIIDDGSEDNSAEMCRELLRGTRLHLVRNERPSFDNEVRLRRQQWQETLERSPEWILNMDADEMMEESFASGVDALLRQADGDVGCFRLYDMWSETHYREDEYWRAHLVYRPMLLRYRSGFPYRWREQPLHCGRFPDNIFAQPSFTSDYRVQHWGWATPQIRAGKHRRYTQLDPHAQYGWREQYESILDDHPHLVAWS